MRFFLLFSFFVLLHLTLFAQNITITGTVTDAQNKPIPFAFIKDANKNYATYSDPLGNFSLKVDAADRLLVSAINFKDITVKVNNPENTVVAMTRDGGNVITALDPDSFKEILSGVGMTKNVASGYIAKEAELHGSRYFFDTWVHGYIISNDDSIKQSVNSYYNYNKIDGSVLITNDGKTMNQVDRGLVKSFVLFDNNGQAIKLDNVPAIDPNHFVQVLSEGKNYKIYKSFGTKFYPNDYVSNGMTSTGHNYDEIKDVPEYYVIKEPNGTPQKFSLKYKSIKLAFVADGPKVSKYLSEHDNEIDDDYLKAMGDELNN